MTEDEAYFHKISDELVREKTGKDWKQWSDIATDWHMKGMGMTAISWQLRERYKLSPWWSHVVAARCEYERKINF